MLQSAGGKVDHDAFQLRSRALAEAFGHLHAAQAELAAALARYDADGAWTGFRDCVEFLTINCGIDRSSATGLLQVGHALEQLPLLAAAFAAGELSLDKTRLVTRVAQPADDRDWLEIARAATAPQLARICREYRRAADADSPARAQAHLGRRGLWTHWRDDGMLHLVALLPPEEAGIVLAAIEAASAPAVKAAPACARPPVHDPAEDTWAARRSDALTAICTQVLEVGPEAARGSRAAAQMLVHVDVGVLTGAEPEGRCHVEGGPPLSAAVARLLGCGAELVAITERQGLPIDVGGRRRFVNPRQQRALRVRDRFCRFPGCSTPAWLTDGHHIVEWWRGGPTILGNLVSLCKFHHRRCHDGGFNIRGDSRSATFHRPDGTVIGPLRPPRIDLAACGGSARLRADAKARGAMITHQTPHSLAGGERWDARDTASVLLGNREVRARRAALEGPDGLQC